MSHLTPCTLHVMYKSSIIGMPSKDAMCVILLSMLVDICKLLRLNFGRIIASNGGEELYISIPNCIDDVQEPKQICALGEICNMWGVNINSLAALENVYPTVCFETEPRCDQVLNIYSHILTFLKALYSKAMISESFSQSLELYNITHGNSLTPQDVAA